MLIDECFCNLSSNSQQKAEAVFLYEQSFAFLWSCYKILLQRNTVSLCYERVPLYKIAEYFFQNVMMIDEAEDALVFGNQSPKRKAQEVPQSPGPDRKRKPGVSRVCCVFVFDREI